jgi:ATP-dependent Lon protease
MGPALLEVMAERRVLPVLPTGATVVFPGPPMTLGMTGAGAMQSVDAAMRADHQIFCVGQLDAEQEARPDNLHTMGVIARVERMQVGISSIQVVLSGQQRATALDYRPGEPLRAVALPVQEIPPPDPSDTTFLALLRETHERSIELGSARGIAEDVLRKVLETVPEPGPFTDLIASYLEIGGREKQQLLETLPVEARLRRVLLHVQRQLELLKTQQQIKDQVQQELGERQREIYLREQLKAIQRELGEDGDNRELQQLREKLATLDLPEEARAEADRELGRLERSGNESMEAQVIRSYLQWLSELPWNKRTEDTLDLERAQQVLDEDHFGLGDVKDRVLEFLSVRVLNARRAALPTDGEKDAEKARARELAKGPISLFVGPPGVGKTSIAQSIARALGRKYVRIALGGARDEADIRGHRRTYLGAMPGRIIQGIRRASAKNPVILLDEIDKLGVSVHGDPASALLEVLDPAQNNNFTDHYLGVAFDLSEVLFIATGNFMHHISGPLLDRMEVIEFAGYTEREKLEIARRYLVPRQLRDSGLGQEQESFSLTDEALTAIIGEYTRESGVRQLERQIGAVARKLARRLATNQDVPHRVDGALAHELLGRVRVRPEQAALEDAIGVATGLYYTPAGGDIMFVESAIRRRGPGPLPESEPRDTSADVALILTGQLGEVMRESARAALTCVMSMAPKLDIPNELLGALEVHVHVPAGAIPKDGPSAGVTIATALASALSRRPVRKEVAMTGEITLRGRVLPIGGVKEKLLGAERAGITEVVLPEANGRDLDDLPPEVRERIHVHLVKSVSEAIDVALGGMPRSAGNRP